MKKWDRKRFNRAGWLAIVAFIVFMKLFILAPVFEIFDPMAAFVLPLVAMLLPTLFFIGWALKHASRKGAILQTVGVILTFGAFALIWVALWNPQASWDFPIPQGLCITCYITAIILCFVLSSPPGRK